MPLVAVVEGAAGHTVSLMVPEATDQGYALCACEWSTQDALFRNVQAAALRHAQAARAGARKATT